MVKFDIIRQKMKEKGYTQEEMADRLSLSYEVLSGKMEGCLEFTASEIHIISLALGLSLSELEDIFFADFVDFNSTN